MQGTNSCKDFPQFYLILHQQFSDDECSLTIAACIIKLSKYHKRPFLNYTSNIIPIKECLFFKGTSDFKTCLCGKPIWSIVILAEAVPELRSLD